MIKAYVLLSSIYLGNLQYPQPAQYFDKPEQCVEAMKQYDQTQKQNMRWKVSCAKVVIEVGEQK